MTGDLHATFGHLNDLYSAALPYDFAPHHNPEPANLNPEPFTSFFPIPFRHAAEEILRCVHAVDLELGEKLRLQA